MMLSGLNKRMTGLLDTCVMAQTMPGCAATSHQPTSGCVFACFPLPDPDVGVELADLVVFALELLAAPLPLDDDDDVTRQVSGKM